MMKRALCAFMFLAVVSPVVAQPIEPIPCRDPDHLSLQYKIAVVSVDGRHPQGGTREFSATVHGAAIRGLFFRTEVVTAREDSQGFPILRLVLERSAFETLRALELRASAFTFRDQSTPEAFHYSISDSWGVLSSWGQPTALAAFRLPLSDENSWLEMNLPDSINDPRSWIRAQLLCRP